MEKNNEKNKDWFDETNFLLIKPNRLKRELLEWLSERQGQKRFSKDPDIICVNKNGFYDYKNSKIFYDLMTKFDFNSNLFTKTEEQLSLNDFEIDRAFVVWTIDEGVNNPIIKMEKNIQAIEEYAGKVISVEIIKEIIKSDKGVKFTITERRTKDEITYIAYDKNEKEINLDDIPEEYLSDIKLEIYKNKKWEYDFEPFVFLQNNNKQKSDSAYISNEIDDLIALSQKKRDDIFLSSVKVVEIGKGIVNSKMKKNGQVNSEEKAIQNRIAYSKTSIFISDSLSLEGSPKATIVNGQPNTPFYDNAIRTIINTILKKTGGATDVDSKGTVQQSKSEILMSQGDEFKVAKWKLNNRQTKIKELFTKLLKIYQNKYKKMENVSEIYAIISQEEVLSETELIANLISAKEAGFISELMAFARYNQITIVEAYKMKKINFSGGENGI